MESYDIAIIGGGPAGYLAAERAADAGKKVLLAEKRTVGGVCLNEGCIPTKTFLYSAKIFEYEDHKGKDLGLCCENAALDHTMVLARKRSVVNTLVGGVSSALTRKKVDVVRGEAGLRRACLLYTSRSSCNLARSKSIPENARYGMESKKETFRGSSLRSSRFLRAIPAVSFPMSSCTTGCGANRSI